MEAQSRSGLSSAAYPRWVMLEQYLEIIKLEDSSSSSPTDGDDPNTLAAARTSNCQPIQVSLRLAEPPSLSRVFLRIPAGLKEEKSKVLAAHGDSVLLQVRIKEKNQEYYTVEHFVYNAGAHAAEPSRPPSLWLLPAYYERRYLSSLGRSYLAPRELNDSSTGLLRRGEDELVVAELTGLSLSKDMPRVAWLHLFRSGEWKRYLFNIREDWDFPHFYWDTVVSVDDRLLCFVCLRSCVVLIDVFKETPTVEYVKLPMDHREGNRLKRNVCTTAGGGALKFVNIFGRCCCGGAASCDCEHSRHAYTIHTWTMRIGNGNKEWVKDGMVDATELWALDAYKDLPCDPLDRPIVSIDEPEVVCFRMRDTKHDRRTIWQILVNMRSKTIHSVSRHEEDLGYCYVRDNLIPSKVSYFFNTSPSSGRRDDATLTGQSQIGIERSPSVLVDERPIGDSGAGNPLQASEIIEALQEIPSYGLGRDEVKAYRILSKNNGLRLRSLLRLPKNIRKNWLLMEIKASQG